MAFLQGGRVVAVPSTAGAGMQIKTLDAIASGRPVVATSIAMRGIDGAPPTVTVADEPREFADALVSAARADSAHAAEAAQAWASERRARFHDQLQSAVSQLEGAPA
jgi:hypothetical protein